MTIRDRILTLAFVLAVTAVTAAAQPGADNKSIFAPPGEKDPGPSGLKETMTRMQIEQAKKEYAEMLKRGEDAARIAEDIDRRLEAKGHLTSEELGKVSEVEKLVKKIRSELGGNDDEGDNEGDEIETPTTSKDAVKRLCSAAASLYQDLKKSTRFTISATAIETTNAILKFARFLRLSR